MKHYCFCFFWFEGKKILDFLKPLKGWSLSGSLFVQVSPSSFDQIHLRGAAYRDVYLHSETIAQLCVPWAGHKQQLQDFTCGQTPLGHRCHFQCAVVLQIAWGPWERLITFVCSNDDFREIPLNVFDPLCTGDCNDTVIRNPLTRPHATSFQPNRYRFRASIEHKNV